MKHILLSSCLCIFIISFQGCKKQTEQIDISDSIIGRWELRHTSAAMMPNGTSYPAGNGNILKFSDSTYEESRNGQLIKTGKYIVIADTTVSESTCMNFDKGIFTNRLVYDNNFSSTKVFVHISGNTLSFISGCYALDAGHMEAYERISKND